MQQVFKRAEKESIGGRHTIDGGGAGYVLWNEHLTKC